MQEKTGAAIVPNRKPDGHKIRQMALLAGCLLCLVSLSAFAYAKFSDLKGDVAGFASAYQGDGRFEIVITNDSDKELELQDDVKVMQWSTGKEIEGDSGKIRMSGQAIAPHSQGVISIDLSEGYDVEAMEENLPEVTGPYGIRENGTYSGHVNIAGTAGDEIYAVADGVVTEAAFESFSGNFITVDLGDGVTVKYGHLKEIEVSEGEEVKQGQVIATLGQTGMATGPNLLFAVSINGEEVNPFVG